MSDNIVILNPFNSFGSRDMGTSRTRILGVENPASNTTKMNEWKKEINKEINKEKAFNK